MEEPIWPGGAGTCSVVLTRFLGAPTALPSAPDGKRWLDWVVGFLTGPDLPAADGLRAVRLVDGSMVPDPVLGGGCATSFSTASSAPKEAIVTVKWLTLQDTATECANAAFASLALTVWQRPPVTAQALVERLNTKLGEPMLARDFKMDTVRYKWKSAQGAVVGVAEYQGVAGRLFSVSLARPGGPR